MKIIALSGLRYTPKWNKNRKQPEDEQVVIEWNYLSGTDREVIYGFDPVEFDLDGNMTNKMVFKPDNIGLLQKSVRNIINLEVEDIGTYRSATVEDVCNLPELAGLYKEMTTFFTQANTEDEKKN